MTEAQISYLNRNKDRKLSELARETGISYWELRKFFGKVSGKRTEWRMDIVMFGFEIPKMPGYDFK